MTPLRTSVFAIAALGLLVGLTSNAQAGAASHYACGGSDYQACVANQAVSVPAGVETRTVMVFGSFPASGLSQAAYVGVGGHGTLLSQVQSASTGSSSWHLTFTVAGGEVFWVNLTGSATASSWSYVDVTPDAPQGQAVAPAAVGVAGVVAGAGAAFVVGAVKRKE